jgi:hypothetical protein
MVCSRTSPVYALTRVPRTSDAVHPLNIGHNIPLFPRPTSPHLILFCPNQAYAEHSIMWFKPPNYSSIASRPSSGVPRPQFIWEEFSTSGVRLNPQWVTFSVSAYSGFLFCWQMKFEGQTGSCRTVSTQIGLPIWNSGLPSSSRLGLARLC